MILISILILIHILILILVLIVALIVVSMLLLAIYSILSESRLCQALSMLQGEEREEMMRPCSETRKFPMCV